MAAKPKIDTPTHRAKLKARREPYWSKLQRGGFLGYRCAVRGGSWIARWRDERGKHHYRALGLNPSSSERAYDEAAKEARLWFAEAQAGAAGRFTVKLAASRYVEQLKLKKGDAAAADAQGRIDRCILPALGTRPLDRLTTGELEDWRDGLVPAKLNDEARRRAKDSANRNLTTLKALLNAAWRSGRVGSNGAWTKVKAFEKVGEARKIFLSSEQRKRLLENCDGTFRDLVEAALLIGARYGELRTLLVSDFDKKERLLNIREGKTGPRSVPLSDAAFALFSRAAKGKLPTAFLLPRSDGKGWQHSDQDELMREAAKGAKLPRGSVFYVLRHTHISNAVKVLDIHSVAKMCGTSVGMIEKHYGKLIPSDARAKLNQVSFV